MKKIEVWGALIPVGPRGVVDKPGISGVVGEGGGGIFFCQINKFIGPILAHVLKFSIFFYTRKEMNMIDGSSRMYTPICSVLVRPLLQDLRTLLPILRDRPTEGSVRTGKEW